MRLLNSLTLCLFFPKGSLEIYFSFAVSLNKYLPWMHKEDWNHHLLFQQEQQQLPASTICWRKILLEPGAVGTKIVLLKRDAA
jgi:hypothetical protein